MNYAGRNLDVLSLWSSLGVDLPDIPRDNLPTYLPKMVCPNLAHDTFKRHFQINTRKPLVHCFAHCGISGTYEHAVAILLGLYDDKGRPDEKQARRAILKHTRVALGGEESAYVGRGTRKSFDAESESAKDEKRLNRGEFQFLPKHVRAYLDERGIDSSSRGKWQLGYDEEEDRLVIPALDERGAFRFLIRRKLDSHGSLKYLYTRGVLKTSILFGACYLDREAVRAQGLILVEGSLDVIRLHQFGFRNTVGILGTGISKKQVRIVYDKDPRRIYDFFDKDLAGVENIAATKRELTKIPIFVCRFPKHRDDPAEMTKEEVTRALERALPIAQFYRKARNNQVTKELIHG